MGIPVWCADLFLQSATSFFPFYKTGKLSTHSAKGPQKASSQDKAAISLHQKGPVISKQQMPNISITKKKLALHRKNEETTRSNVRSGTSATVSKVNSRYVVCCTSFITYGGMN
jgi:hypothetical protein